MGQTASAIVAPGIDRQSLHRLETHFIASEIYHRDDVAGRQAKLARIVSNEIVPRLLRLHDEVIPAAPPVIAVVEALAPTSADITGLADIVLGSDLEAAAAYVLLLRERGLSMETLFLELLEPTARLLGEMWDRDDGPNPALDGGDGLATVGLDKDDAKTVEALMLRTRSDPAVDSLTGADLGAGPGAGRTTEVMEA